MRLARNGSDQVTEHHRNFYDEYNAVHDIPAESYLATVKNITPRHRWGMAGFFRPTLERAFQKIVEVIKVHS